MVASVVLRFGFGAACEHHNGIRQCVARSHKPQIAPYSRRTKLPDLRRAKKGVALQGGPKLPHDQETEKAEKANQGSGKRSCDPPASLVDARSSVIFKRDEMSAEVITASRRRGVPRCARHA